MLKIAWHPIYKHPLPENHRFPMEKYELLPQQLLHEGTVGKESFFSPGLLAEEDILRSHTLEYWRKLNTGSLSRAEERKTGFPYSPQLVERERTINQGTIDCAKYAFEYGISFNIAGGTHHAFTDRGEGFCLLNDQAIAAHYLLAHGLSTKILIVDLDVHQGNGTAEIFTNVDEVFTFSMHGARNYPSKKEKSDLDVGLPDGTRDKEYLQALDENLKGVWDRFDPDFVFYQCGVDVLEEDKLGRLALTINGCKERDKMVLNLAKKNSVPLVACMGGGYAGHIHTIIQAHANTYREAVDLFF